MCRRETVVSVSRGGHGARRGDACDPPSSAYELLGETSGLSPSIDSDLPPGWLADLDVPRLVITPDYVGPPRRRDERGGSAEEAVSGDVLVVDPEPDCATGVGEEAVRRGRVLRPRHLVTAVVATVATVVPLTLVATHIL